MVRNIEDLIEYAGSSSDLKESVRKLPLDIFAGFNIIKREEFSLTTWIRASKERGCFLDGRIDETYIKFTIYNPHCSFGVFEIPIIRPPQGAEDVASISPTANIDKSVGGICFKYKGDNYMMEYAFDKQALRIIEENTAGEYLKKKGLVSVKEGTKIIVGAGE